LRKEKCPRIHIHTERKREGEREKERERERERDPLITLSFKLHNYKMETVPFHMLSLT
jgi:hypothetical protein